MASSSQKHRLRISKFVVEFRVSNNVLLIVMRNDRNDLPHLTISFNNPSKTLNIHLTKRVRGEQDHRIDVAKINDADIGSVMESFLFSLKQSMLQTVHKLKPIRPGWLARKGYAVILFDTNTENLFLDMAVPARRYHGKDERLLDSSTFESYVASFPVEKYIFPPSILHKLIGHKLDYPVFAFRRYGKHKPATIGIFPLRNRNGKMGWFAINEIVKLVSETAEKHLVSSLSKLLPKDSWRTIYDKMQLHELGIEM